VTADRPIVLVTGSSGLIGRLVVDRLKRDFAVRGLDIVPGPSSVVGDVRDVATARAACHGVRSIVHLAGDPRADAPWDAVLEANVVGTLALFEAARLEHVERVVLASSNHVVGMYEAEQAPQIYEREDSKGVISTAADVRPDSPYGVSKACAEVIARFYSDRYGMRVACLRLGSVVPEDDPWRAAQRIADGGDAVPAFRRYRATWLSHRDCVALVAAALQADIRWAVAYGVSDNPGRFWDLGPAETLLGFRPKDKAPTEPPSPGR
jgi:nucleoside-diphosphate-sugar epimerase